MDPEIDVFGTQTSSVALAFGLNGVADWSVQQPFLDVFKTARPWHGHTSGHWGAYLASDLDAMGALDDQGWIREMPTGVDRIEAFILTEIPVEASYTGGLYRLSYDGLGAISVFGAQVVSQSDGEIWFNYTPTGHGMVTVSISATDPGGTGNNLRNIEVVKQEHIPAFEAGQIFNPLWLNIIDDAHALRFMDWMETNNSPVSAWSDRPIEGNYTYMGGVPVEVMVELANQAGTEPWFNIPWNADQTYIREFATYVRDTLNPDLRAHFELSNEVWNWMFTQAGDAADASRARFGQDLGDGWVQEYGARAVEMAQALDAVYAGHDDALVKVISTHPFWPGLEDAILNAPAWQAQNPGQAAPYTHFDTYAITGYFGGALGNSNAPIVLTWLDESEARAELEASQLGLSGTARAAYIAEHRYDLATDLAVRDMRDGSITGQVEESMEGLFELFRYHSQVADQHGLDLVMYEGGTHVVGVGSWVNNQRLTDFFAHLNYSDEMGVLYRELLQGWEAFGGTLFNAFVDVAHSSKWGSWGALRHLEDDNPRFDALADFMLAHPAPEHMKDGTWNSQPSDWGPAPEPQPDPDPEPAPPLLLDQATDWMIEDSSVETLALSGDQSSYTLQLGSDNVTLTDRRVEGDGTLALGTVETLDFATEVAPFGASGMELDAFDGIVELDPEDVAALTELYIAYFNRAPDAVGLFYWGNQMADGMSLRDIADMFYQQPETRAIYGDQVDTEQFVITVYQNVLGRAPDPAGITYWVAQLGTGGSVRPSNFIPALIEGAKSSTGSRADAEYLASKVALGTYFALHQGMSDVDNASAVMRDFDGSAESLAAGRTLSDAFFAEARSSTGGEFLMQLVGVFDDATLF